MGTEKDKFNRFSKIDMVRFQTLGTGNNLMIDSNFQNTISN